MKKITKTVAELQAHRKQLEQDKAIAAVKTDEIGKSKVAEIQAKMESTDWEIEAAENQAAEIARRGKLADEALACMEAQGALHVQGDEAAKRKVELKASFVENPSLIETIAGPSMTKAAELKAAAALNGAGGARVAPNAGSVAVIEKFGLEAGASYGYQMSAGWNTREALRGYAKLVLANNKVRPTNSKDLDAYAKKSTLAIEAANWYNRHLKGDNLTNWEHIEGYNLNKAAGLEAADYSDPSGAGTSSLGVLSGTLVLQRTLPVFKYKYPELLSMMTDFSDTPGLYEQTETTRIVVQPPVQRYNATANADGRPGGWTTISPAVTTNVSITLTDYIAVPIAIGENILAATTRRLFDEQAVLAIAGIAGYFTTMLTNLITSANYNYYAAPNGILVPTAHATYIKGLQQWGMPALNDLDSVFTSSKVPEDGRGLLLNPAYYAALRNDSNLLFYYAASAKSLADAGDFVSEPLLPKLSGFAPYKAGYMPSSTPATAPTTSNVVGFVYQKAGVILKSRLPTDFSTALGGVMFPGSITTVSDPDTKISVMLVQYINPTQNYAEWRPEVMLGASVGDNRAGLVITSQ